MGNISTKFEDCAAICPLVMVHFLSEQYNDLVTLTFDLLSSVVVCEVDLSFSPVVGVLELFVLELMTDAEQTDWVQCVLRPPKVMSMYEDHHHLRTH